MESELGRADRLQNKEHQHSGSRGEEKWTAPSFVAEQTARYGRDCSPDAQTRADQQLLRVIGNFKCGDQPLIKLL